MADRDYVFLSYNRNDRPAALEFREKLRPLTSVFRDDESIHAGEKWLERIQAEVDGCRAFVVLVGRDALTRWVGAETQVALARHFGPHDEAKRLPIFPILLGDINPGSQPEPPRPLTDHATLPAFLRLFQAKAWRPGDPLPEDLLDQIRKGTFSANKELALEEGKCPFVGLQAFQARDAHLFFGRRRETLDVLACFFDRRAGKPVRWLEVDGNSGSGKSSLMNAGILPLVVQGWLWRPRSGFNDWILIGPMMPGERPLTALAKHLTIAFRARGEKEEMADVRKRMEEGDERALADWLGGRTRKGTAFLLAIDQFEELFTFAEGEERRRFDGLLACALEDPDCPLFLISTVRSDFLDRFDGALPWLGKVRNERASQWTVLAMGAAALREVIEGPAGLVGLDVSEVRETLVREAKDEPGALPLVENALTWLWERRSNNRLSGELLNDQDGAAGIFSHSADRVLDVLDAPQRQRALDLLLRLVKVDPEGQRHTRRRIPRAVAIDVAGGGVCGEALVYRLAGQRSRELGLDEQGPMRLITSIEEGRQVTLIHETLIRSKRQVLPGQRQPYWPTLWTYIENNRGQAAARDRTRLLAVMIEDAATKWDAVNRPEDRRWSEDQLLEVLNEIRQSGLAVAEVIRPGVSEAFFGPARAPEIIDMLALTADADGAKGSGRYGAWRLPLGHKQRAALAERLAVLGDPRDGVGLRDGLPDIDWVTIEGGEVRMEIEGGLTQAVERFRIARYPITIDQFKAFVDDCYRDGRWHLPPGCPVAVAANLEPPTHRSSRGNYAADNISWYDAMAFCHWLSTRLSADTAAVSLPTEFQWQLAATGGDPRRIYPWSDPLVPDRDAQREPWRANTSEYGLGRTLPVGFYPLGASPAGVLDMAGDLWEWCLTSYDHPDREVPASEMVLRVLRGGSWSLNQVIARLADRNRSNPNYRNSFIGFRVVCSSPSPGTDP